MASLEDDCNQAELALARHQVYTNASEFINSKQQLDTANLLPEISSLMEKIGGLHGPPFDTVMEVIKEGIADNDPSKIAKLGDVEALSAYAFGLSQCSEDMMHIIIDEFFLGICETCDSYKRCQDGITCKFGRNGTCRFNHADDVFKPVASSGGGAAGGGGGAAGGGGGAAGCGSTALKPSAAPSSKKSSGGAKVDWRASTLCKEQQAGKECTFGKKCAFKHLP